MAQNVYDPYGSTQGLSYGSVIKDVATMPLKPSTYLGMYSMMPRMWSTSQGVRMPFIGKALEQGGMKGVFTGVRNVASRAYTGRSAVGGTIAFGKDIGSRVMSFGEKGGGFVGEKFLNKTIDLDTYNFSKNYFDATKKFTESSLKKSGKGLSSSVIHKQSKAAAVAASRTFKNTGALATGNIGRKSAHVAKVLSNVQGQKAAVRLATKQGALKLGLTAMKGASFIGGAMLAYDLISMVGAPLGRAAVRGLDTAMGEYERRFMPELGGKLQMSYLSQGAATERQRAIESISKAHINGRSAFGQEANMIHEGFR